MPKKFYVLDTNVLIHDPQSLFSFEKSEVVIPMIVLEELDQFKSDNSQRGRSTREVVRLLDGLRAKGSLRKGVTLDNGGTLRVASMEPGRTCSDLPVNTPDNSILNLTACLKQDLKGDQEDVTLVSKDINMRVKADVIGITAVDYTKGEVSREHFYKGWIRFQVPAVQLKKQVPPDLLELAGEYQFSPNEYVIVESQHNEHIYKLFRYTSDKEFKPIIAPQLGWGIEPRNVQQLIALDLLLDDTIQCVTLSGPAGTGKTFLALVAALHKLLVDHTYSKILISRPVIPLGPDIGYLPGTIEEKLHSWMQPIYDNMEFIVHAANASHQPMAMTAEEYEDRDRFRNKKKQFHRPAFPTLAELIQRGKVSLEAITYMRGRSIPFQYIFIDEVQNLSPHEVKTIVSRVGEGSKIVLAGDPYQIDSPYLDFVSNGLMVASERFKGKNIFGTAFLEISERSQLSQLAGELL